jgi:hypothetical protein
MNINPIRIQMSVGVGALVGVNLIAFSWLLSRHGLNFVALVNSFWTLWKRSFALVGY